MDHTDIAPPDASLQSDAAFPRAVLEASGDCIKVLDLEANLVFMTEAGQRVMEVSDFNAIAGCPWPSFWHGQGNVDVHRALDIARAGGTGRFSGHARTMAGKSRWWDVQVTPIRGADGRPEKLLAISRDVTARHVNEMRLIALVELGDRLRGQDAVDGIVAVAAEVIGTTLAVSRVAYGSFDTVGGVVTVEKDWTQGVASVAGAHHVHDFGTFKALLQEGRLLVVGDVRSDARVDAARMESLDIRALVNVPVVEQGQVVGMLCVHDREPHPWTDEELDFMRSAADRTWAAVMQVRARVAERASQNELRRINGSLEKEVSARTRERDRVWNTSQDIQIVLDRASVVRAVNPSVTTLLGWLPEEVVGRSIFDFLVVEDRAGAHRALATRIYPPTMTYENCYRHKDGGTRWFSWVVASDGDLIYASGRHITREKEAADALAVAQDQLRQSQKMEAVGQLTGGLAHDFNNLLAGISGSLELIKLRIAQGRFADLERYVAAAQGASRRAASLTHRLLSFSRRQTLDPKTTDANRLVSGIEELIRRTVGPSIELDVVTAADLWMTLVDPYQLGNALINLCINARDAMPGGGRLTIETANRWLDARSARERDVEPGQYISLCVTDTGSGMTPEVIGRAFDPFFTTKAIGEGTGLGLSMVYGFARQSNGQIRIYSEVGQGTTMCLYLPRSLGVDEHEEHDAPSTLAAADHATAVLIVDDEPTVLMLIADVLDELGFKTYEAGDGPAALAQLHGKARIDLMITDIGLPGGTNGRQLADAALLARPALKILFITGYAENAVLNNGYVPTGMQVLTKPFTIEQLKSKVDFLMPS